MTHSHQDSLCSRDYGHEQAWHDGNGHSHLQAMWMGPALTVPVKDGRPVLGHEGDGGCGNRFSYR